MVVMLRHTMLAAVNEVVTQHPHCLLCRQEYLITLAHRRQQTFGLRVPQVVNFKRVGVQKIPLK